MKFKDILFVCGDTMRTKAYLQAMIKADYLPGRCLIMTQMRKDLETKVINKTEPKKNEPYFDADAPLLWLLQQAKIPYGFLESKDVNSNIVTEALKTAPEPYIIYSGYGGYILKSNLFQIGKRYIHVHAGILPKYRGSTTAYYSILQEGYIGASAIFLEEKLDAGDIICENKFPLPPSDVNIDYIYEPYTRSQVLVQALKQYKEQGRFMAHRQSQDEAETYYIIHPVLKHLAILKVTGQGEKV